MMDLLHQVIEERQRSIGAIDPNLESWTKITVECEGMQAATRGGPKWTHVVRRVLADVDTGDVLEDIAISEHVRND